jgi:hypothetical protein
VTALRAYGGGPIAPPPPHLLAPIAVLESFHDVRRWILLGRPQSGDGIDQSVKKTVTSTASFDVRLGVPPLNEIGGTVRRFLQERLHVSAWRPFFVIFV